MISVNDILINDISFFIRLQSALLFNQKITVNHKEHFYKNTKESVTTPERFRQFPVFLRNNTNLKEISEIFKNRKECLMIQANAKNVKSKDPWQDHKVVISTESAIIFWNSQRVFNKPLWFTNNPRQSL